MVGFVNCRGVSGCNQIIHLIRWVKRTMCGCFDWINARYFWHFKRAVFSRDGTHISGTGCLRGNLSAFMHHASRRISQMKRWRVDIFINQVWVWKKQAFEVAACFLLRGKCMCLAT